MKPRVLIVGPLPPPYGGATVSFKTFLEQFQASFSGELQVLNAAPGRVRSTPALRLVDLYRGITLAWHIGTKSVDTVLVFGSVGFQMYFAPLLAWVKRRRGVRIVVSFFGSSLYEALVNLPEFRRRLVEGSLRNLDSVIVETDFVGARLRDLGWENVVVIPGYRSIPRDALPTHQRVCVGPLRLVFMSQVRAEKGIFVLLEALQLLEQAKITVECHIYGPVFKEIEESFHRTLARTPSAHYHGIANGNIPEIISQHDVMVLPTSWPGEGHPGVVIESMIAGVPVVASRFRAIPELIEDGVNGLLVETGSVTELVAALTSLAKSPADVVRMGLANRERLYRHDVVSAVRTVEELL